MLTQQFVEKQLGMLEQKNEWVSILLAQRTYLVAKLNELSFVEHIFPTQSNFVLVKVFDANAVYRYLVGLGIVVRNRNTVSLCLGCLRITVGTQEENDILLEALAKYKN